MASLRRPEATVAEDFYVILSIERSATLEEIKKQGRRLLRDLHPDRNPGNAVAEERFKIVNDALSVLGDLARRMLYDEFGHDGLRPGFPVARVRGERAYAERNPDPGDRLEPLFVTDDEMRVGFQMAVTKFSWVKCSHCAGNGHALFMCSGCNGVGGLYLGKTRCETCIQYMVPPANCPTCGGWGVADTVARCIKCSGHRQVLEGCNWCAQTGMVCRPRKGTAKIAPGIEGELVRIKDGIPTGDLYYYRQRLPDDAPHASGSRTW